MSWSERRDLNSQHPDWKSGTLPIELRSQIVIFWQMHVHINYPDCNGTSFSPIMYHCSRTGFINDIVIRPRYRTQLFLHVADQLKIEGFSCYRAFPHLVLTDPSFQLQRASTHNTCTLCRLFSDTEKHSGDFIFTIVAPALDGYLACSELVDHYLAVHLTPFTTAADLLISSLQNIRTTVVKFQSLMIKLRGTKNFLILLVPLAP